MDGFRARVLIQRSVSHGAGDQGTFNKVFADPITRSKDPNASAKGCMPLHIPFLVFRRCVFRVLFWWGSGSVAVSIVWIVADVLWCWCQVIDLRCWVGMGVYCIRAIPCCGMYAFGGSGFWWGAPVSEGGEFLVEGELPTLT